MKVFVFFVLFFVSGTTFSRPLKSTSNIDRILEIDTTASEKFLKKGIEKRALNDYEGAKLDFTNAIKKNPKNVKAYLNRAYLNEILGVPFEAIEDYSKVLELNPKDVDTYISRAFVKWGLNELQSAIHDLDLAIGLDKKNGEAHFYRGLLMLLIDKREEGCEDLYKAKELQHDITDEELLKYCK